MATTKILGQEITALSALTASLAISSSYFPESFIDTQLLYL